MTTTDAFDATLDYRYCLDTGGIQSSETSTLIRSWQLANQMHKCTFTCVKGQEGLKKVCRFGFPMNEMNYKGAKIGKGMWRKGAIITKVKDKKGRERTRVHPRRNCGHLNNHLRSPLMSLANRGNHDFSFIDNDQGAPEYCAKYSSKADEADSVELRNLITRKLQWYGLLLEAEDRSSSAGASSSSSSPTSSATAAATVGVAATTAGVIGGYDDAAAAANIAMDPEEVQRLRRKKRFQVLLESVVGAQQVGSVHACYTLLQQKFVKTSRQIIRLNTIKVSDIETHALNLDISSYEELDPNASAVDTQSPNSVRGIRLAFVKMCKKICIGNDTKIPPDWDAAKNISFYAFVSAFDVSRHVRKLSSRSKIPFNVCPPKFVFDLRTGLITNAVTFILDDTYYQKRTKVPIVRICPYIKIDEENERSAYMILILFSNWGAFGEGAILNVTNGVDNVVDNFLDDDEPFFVDEVVPISVAGANHDDRDDDDDAVVMYNDSSNNNNNNNNNNNDNDDDDDDSGGGEEEG